MITKLVMAVSFIDKYEGHGYLRLMRFFIFMLLFTSLVRGSDSHLLYTAHKAGSESLFNPLSYYLNESFDTIQNSTWFTQKKFFANHQLVWKRVRDPFAGVRQGGGFKKLVHDEIVPYSPRALPNYSLHLIGGGYDYRRLAEWFDLHQYSHPYVWAFFAQYAAAFGNESLEASNVRDVGAHDHIADLYIFDLAGKFLFMNDDVALFFRDKADLHAWPFQPMYNVKTNHINNAATNFIIRPDIMHSNVRPFFHAGMQILGGVSYLQNNEAYSLALGAAPTDPLRGKMRLVSAFFWDREGSLLTSLYVNGGEDQRFRLNIFPGVVKMGSISPGVFTALMRNNSIEAGLSVVIPIGAGISF